MAPRTILIVPPKGTRIHAFRVRLSMLILAGLLILAGFAGYFIPFDSFTLDVIEQNKKRNLADQNSKLLLRIISSAHIQDKLKSQISRLDSKQRHINEISGIRESKDRVRAKRDGIADLESDTLLGLVNRRENLFQFYSDGAGSGSNIFEQIPVNRPVQGRIVISNPFGVCKDPFTGKNMNHQGIDFVAVPGTPVLATASGNIRSVETGPMWGKRIVIDHAAGFSTVYAHLGSIMVTAHKQVKRGEQIGSIGVSGMTTEPHVHYEVWRNGEVVDPAELFFPSIDSIISPAISSSVN